MKIIKVICFLTLASPCAFSQAITVTGTVSNQKGQPVQYAFVRDVQHNHATFTDSTGVFKLKSDPASSLIVLANNYEDQQLKIGDKSKVDIVLATSSDQGSVSSLKSGQSSESTPFLQHGQLFVTGNGTVASTGNGNTHTGGTGGSDVQVAKSGFAQEATRGSRYLFDDWVPGFGVDKNDKMVIEKTNMYNFDKISGNIIFTNDGKSMAQVSPSQLNSFTLYDKKGHSHNYENAPEINKKPFVEVLLKTPKYKIYKKIDSKLSRADYHTDGVLEMGHRYDEFTDVERYVFVSAADNKPVSMSLKKSSLKKLLTGDADAFIASQGSRDVDEEYVKELGESLSK